MDSFSVFDFTITPFYYLTNDDVIAIDPNNEQKDR